MDRNVSRLDVLRPRGQLALVILFALFLRLAGIFSRPTWYDESFSILFSQKGIFAMLSGTISQTGGVAADVHPLGYYILLSVWLTLFGDSLFVARFFSLLAGLGLIFMAYVLAQRFWGHSVGLIAAFVVACSPFQIHYAQEIRMYVWMTLWLIMAVYSYWRAQETAGWAWWFGFAFFAALAQYTHHLSAVFLVSLAIFPLLQRDWDTVKRIIIAGVVALLLYLPWLVHLPGQLAKVQTSYWTEPPGIERVFTTLLSFTTNLPLPNIWLGPALFVALLITLTAIWQAFRVKQRSGFGLWVMYMVFAPTALLFVISHWTPVFIERALLPSGFMFCLWIVWAFWQNPAPQFLRWLILILLAAGSLIGFWQHLTYRDFPYAPFAQIDSLIRDNLQAGDIIVHSNKLTAFPAIYFNPDLPHRYIADPPGGSTDTLALATQQTLGWIASADLDTATRAAPRVWLVIFRRSDEEAREQGLLQHPHLAWMQSNYSLQKTYEMGSVLVYLYSK